jgi:hypothetical protein
VPADPLDFLPPELRSDITLARLLGDTHLPPKFSLSSADQILMAFESPLLAQAFDSSMAVNTTDWALAMTDARFIVSALLLPEPAVVTGAAFYVQTAGVYTADANNKVGLYTLAMDGLNLERLAMSASDGNMWKTAGMIQKPFSAPLSLESGVYWAAVLWNASATTTAPKLVTQTTIDDLLVNPLLPTTTVGRSLLLATQTDLPATASLAAMTNSTSTHWLGFY